MTPREQHIRHGKNRAIPLVICAWSALCMCHAFPGPISFVLTDNATGSEAGLTTGCTYTAEPPFTNPADPKHHRLIDRGGRWNDWNNTVGINAKQQTVTFDLKRNYRLDAVSLEFNHSQKPASVDVSVAAKAEGPWTNVGTMTAEQAKGAWWRIDTGGAVGRYVRLFHQIKTWGWYLREVKIYGGIVNQGVEPAKHRGKSLVLAEHGKAYAVIVVADNPTACALEAAGVLHNVVQQMTGAMLPIIAASDVKDGPATILVGPSRLAAGMGVSMKQDRDGGDRYVLRSQGDRIALVGNDDGPLRGSLYAVYDFLERLGCGWFGPDPVWQVIPKVTTLAVGPLEVVETPDFDYRRIWMVKGAVRDAWRLGGRSLSCGHCLGRLVPRKQLAAQHPDWFGEGQPCLTNPGVIQHIVEQFRRKLDAEKTGIVPLCLGANDSGGFCQCQRCRAVGNISARQLYLANAVARELAKTHPHRYLLTFYAYWYSHDAPVPRIKAEPGVCVMMVNEGNHVQPWDKPEPPAISQTTSRNNTREIRAFAGWKATGAIMAIYEWWIPGCSNKDWRNVPWYSGETAMRNLRFWKREGVKFVNYETQYENGNGFPLRWPLYYVAARGMWDTRLTAKQIMHEACEKLYGPAARPMLNYYEVIEQAMADGKFMGGNWNLPSPEKIYTPDIEARASECLAKAAGATDNVHILARIQQEQRVWDGAKAVLARLRIQAEKPAFTVVVNGKSMPWKKSTITIRSLRSLFGIEANTPIFAVEIDGQKRLAKAAETFDLTSKVTFSTKP